MKLAATPDRNSLFRVKNPEPSNPLNASNFLATKSLACNAGWILSSKMTF